MKIVTRFKLAELFCVLLVAVIVAVLFSTSMAMQRELAKNKAAADILQAVTSLRYLSIEYALHHGCLLYTSPSPRDQRGSRMPSSA